MGDMTATFRNRLRFSSVMPDHVASDLREVAAAWNGGRSGPVVEVESGHWLNKLNNWNYMAWDPFLNRWLGIMVKLRDWDWESRSLFGITDITLRPSEQHTVAEQRADIIYTAWLSADGNRDAAVAVRVTPLSRRLDQGGDNLSMPGEPFKFYTLGALRRWKAILWYTGEINWSGRRYTEDRR